MLRPKNFKYKKIHKPCLKNCILDFKNTNLKGGIYGVKVLEPGIIRSKELESVKKLVQKRLKRKGKVLMCVYPTTFTTSKPLEVRMGKGKGSLNEWVSLVSKGTVVMEIILDENINLINLKVLVESCERLSLKSKIIKYIS